MTKNQSCRMGNKNALFSTNTFLRSQQLPILLQRLPSLKRLTWLPAVPLFADHPAMLIVKQSYPLIF